MEQFEIQNLSFSYPTENVKTEKKKALDSLSFQVKEGEFFIICGKSGCGKTTLLRHFKTVLTPNGSLEGSIFYQGENLSNVSLRRQAGEIGFVQQRADSQIVTDKVWHELAFGMENLGFPNDVIRRRIAEIVNYFGMDEWFEKDVETLSGGQKQILNLASVMTLQPKVLLLDEPTSQLDPITASKFLQTLHQLNQELGVTIIMIEQRLEEVIPMADHVLILEDGKMIYNGIPRKLAETIGKNDIFYAMPTPMRVYAAIEKGKDCPLTIAEGRRWLRKYLSDKGMSENKESEIEKNNKKTLDEQRRENVLQAENLWFRYEKNEKDILKGVTFNLKEGEMFCLLGGNGAGKSTLLSVLTGLRKTYRGKVKCKKKIGLLVQNPELLFTEDTVYKELYGRRNKEDEKIKKIIADTELERLLKHHPYDLSGGEKQRLGLAKILMEEPEIILLDEPTKGLDAYYKYQFAQILKEIRKQGISILMVSHDLEFCAAFADRCGMFFQGSITSEGTAQDFFYENSFYTTQAGRMARDILPGIVRAEDIITILKQLN